MGSRAGYQVRSKYNYSPILRKQWQTSLEVSVPKMWETLGGKPGDGGQAIREDLEIDRGFAALVVSFYDAPFDSIHATVNCDISDNGLFVIDITNWKHWRVCQYEVDFRVGTIAWDSKKEIAEMTEEGFNWLVNESERANIGEGIS